MSRADGLYVTYHDMPVLPLRNAVRCSGSEAVTLPFIVDPIGIGPITDIRFTVAGALDPESAEFSVADSGDGVSGRDVNAPGPDGMLSCRAIRFPRMPALASRCGSMRNREQTAAMRPSANLTGTACPPVVRYQDKSLPDPHNYERQEFNIPRREEAIPPSRQHRLLQRRYGHGRKGEYNSPPRHLAYRAVPYPGRAVLARLKRFLEADTGLYSGCVANSGSRPISSEHQRSPAMKYCRRPYPLHDMIFASVCCAFAQANHPSFKAG